jgi:hypothetical protein
MWLKEVNKERSEKEKSGRIKPEPDYWGPCKSS